MTQVFMELISISYPLRMFVPQKQCVSAVGELKEAATRTNTITTEWEPGLYHDQETLFTVDFWKHDNV